MPYTQISQDGTHYSSGVHDDDDDEIVDG